MHPIPDSLQPRRYTPRSRLLATACLSAAAAFATADVEAQPLDYGAFETLFSEPVTTSVTGSPQRASRVPASMEIVSAEQIRRAPATDIPGILQHVAGVDVLRWTNSGADVSVRGYNEAFSSRLLVLVNGRQVYADHYGYTPWSSLPVEIEEIRQIEVVKGPNSALFGFNAVGGVINIVTYNPLSDDVNFASVRAGTQDSLAGSAAGTFAVGDAGGIRISGGSRRNDDFSTAIRPVNEGSRRGDERESARLDAHFAPSSTVELEVEASYTRADQNNMSPAYMMAFEEMTTRSIKALAHAETRFGLVQGSIYRNWLDNDGFADTFGGQGDVPFVSFDNEVTVAQLQNVFKIGAAHTFRVSAEYRESSLDTTPVTGATVAYDVASGGALWQWQATPNIVFTAAARRDRLDLGRMGVIPDGFGFTNADWDRSIDETSYNAGLVWDLGGHGTLRLTTARGTQLPNLFDLGGNLFAFPVPPPFQPPEVGYFAGLPDLEPVVVTNHELAWDRELPALDARLTAAYFRGESRDLVATNGRFLPESGVFSAPANIGDSSTEGFEVSVDGTIGEDWRWGVGYVNQRIDDEFQPQFLTGFTLTDYEHTTPRHVVNANFGWARAAWEVDAYVRYQSSFSSIHFDTDFEFDPADPFAEPQVLVPVSRYAAVDGRLAYSFNDGVSVALSGQNLFSGEQRQTSGPRVERRVIVSVEMDF